MNYKKFEEKLIDQGQAPVIYVGCDLNRLNDHPNDKSVFLKLSKVLDDLTIDGILRIKFKDINIEPRYTYYLCNTRCNPSHIDYLLVSKKLIIDMF